MTLEEVEKLPILQAAACMQATFERRWQVANVPVEITTTWASDLWIALVCENDMNDKDAIEKTINGAILNWKSNFTYFSQFIMAINFMSWVCYDSNKYGKYSSLFSDWYYKLLDIADKNLTVEEQSRLYQILD